MSNETSGGFLGAVLKDARRSAGWEMAIGALCILAPLLAGVAVVVALGALLLLCGLLFTRAATLEPRGAPGRGWRIAAALLLAFLGVYLVFVPVVGLVVFTWILSAALIVFGSLRVLGALALRPSRGWGLLLVAGLVSAVAGLLLMLDLPLSGRWALGTWIGVSLLTDGWTRWAVAGAVKDAVGR